MERRAIVVGAGRMGMAARYAFEKLGYAVNMVDPNIAGENVHPTIDKALDNMVDADVVLSCAPYFANLDIAQFCAKAELNYCDLGGDPNTGFAIQKLFHNHKLTEELATDFNGTPFRPYKAKCLTDLGLAPGLVNILGYHYAAQLRPKNLVMAVGGLPQNPNSNTMKYNTTWSPDGLYNEYMGDCYVLKDGKMATEPALEGYERLGGGVYEDWLEMFNTKGELALY